MNTAELTASVVSHKFSYRSDGGGTPSIQKPAYTRCSESYSKEDLDDEVKPQESKVKSKHDFKAKYMEVAKWLKHLKGLVGVLRDEREECTYTDLVISIYTKENLYDEIKPQESKVKSKHDFKAKFNESADRVKHFQGLVRTLRDEREEYKDRVMAVGSAGDRLSHPIQYPYSELRVASHRLSHPTDGGGAPASQNPAPVDRKRKRFGFEGPKKKKSEDKKKRKPLAEINRNTAKPKSPPEDAALVRRSKVVHVESKDKKHRKSQSESTTDSTNTVKPKPTASAASQMSSLPAAAKSTGSQRSSYPIRKGTAASASDNPSDIHLDRVVYGEEEGQCVHEVTYAHILALNKTILKQDEIIASKGMALAEAGTQNEALKADVERLEAGKKAQLKKAEDEKAAREEEKAARERTDRRSETELLEKTRMIRELLDRVGALEQEKITTNTQILEKQVQQYTLVHSHVYL
jgi:hypothetical protein